MPKLEITNMVMVRDKTTGRVLVQERVKNWCGIAFPGGHVEDGETIYDSAVREVKEETGLDIKNLEPCGLMQWFNNKTRDHYFIYFYKTSDYTGELVDRTDEGRVFWVSPEELPDMKLARNFIEYLSIFLGEKYKEAYCSWNDDMKPDMTKKNPWGIIFR